MKLNQLGDVLMVAASRESLLTQRDQGKLAVTLDGEALDEGFIELLRPHVIGELNGRIAAHDRKLASLGVAID